MPPTHGTRHRFAFVAGLLCGGQALASAVCAPAPPSSGAADVSVNGEAKPSAGDAAAQSADLSTGTHVVLLGTGTPNPEPAASGPATAVLVDGRAYLVDAGPGIVRRAAEAAERYAVEGLTAARLDIAFLTHLHSDHTVGLPDLIHTPWVAEREAPLKLFGPDGTAAMAMHLTAAWEADFENRLSGRQPATPDGWRVEAVDIDPGVIYEDDRVRVTAFAVPHTGWPEAYGYRFEGAGRSVVISGDTAPTEAIVEMCAGCDVLVHEVYSATTFRDRPPEWQMYHAQAHTSTVELAELATRARPGILVLHHQLGWGATPEGMVAEIRAAGYEGPLAYGRDLDVY
ncbi:MBL fold metallo-hydrolase [Candidatus Palauibacter sp.]|uniref:MBL fold metallo-hydrolase n=1 Tax=Candidatus Palauibacter sp. TaxID=3101350 RepID=UPI003B5A2107